MLLFLFLLVSCIFRCREVIADDYDNLKSDPKAGSMDQGNEDNDKNRLRSVFLLIDSDGNGQISVQELASRTERSMKTFYRQEANTRLMELDKNVDGKVTWEEYIKGANNRGAFTEQQKKRDNKRYTTADLNKDGALSSDELVSMFHPEESAHMSPVIVEEFMAFADIDKDGYLSFDEYKETTLNSGRTNVRAAEKSFKRLDSDQDGKLNEEEMKLWLSAINTSSQAKNQAERQVKMADDNKDGVLSQEEMLNHMQLFTAGHQGYQSQAKIKDEL